MRDSSLPRFAARIGLAASDVAFPLVIALVLTLGFASPAYAYVDPSVMTYTIPVSYTHLTLPTIA